MDEKFDRMYMNHTSNIYDEWEEEQYRQREAYNKGRCHHASYSGNLNGNSGSIKSPAISSQMQSALCTNCVIYQAEKKD